MYPLTRRIPRGSELPVVNVADAYDVAVCFVQVIPICSIYQPLSQFRQSSLIIYPYFVKVKLQELWSGPV